MKAITLWQPWASLLACGAKQYETRSWATSYRGPIAIHAAKEDPKPIYDSLPIKTQLAMTTVIFPLYSLWEAVPRGCIIATAELVGCHLMCRNPYDGVVHYLDHTDAAVCIDGNELLFGDWTPGRYAWEFADMKMLSEPISAKGHQRLWNWEWPEGLKGEA